MNSSYLDTMKLTMTPMAYAVLTLLVSALGAPVSIVDSSFLDHSATTADESKVPAALASASLDTTTAFADNSNTSTSIRSNQGYSSQASTALAKRNTNEIELCDDQWSGNCEQYTFTYGSCFSLEDGVVAKPTNGVSSW
jgi:hypothetical protein